MLRPWRRTAAPNSCTHANAPSCGAENSGSLRGDGEHIACRLVRPRLGRLSPRLQPIIKPIQGPLYYTAFTTRAFFVCAMRRVWRGARGTVCATRVRDFHGFAAALHFALCAASRCCFACLALHITTLRCTAIAVIMQDDAHSLTIAGWRHATEKWLIGSLRCPGTWQPRCLGRWTRPGSRWPPATSPMGCRKSRRCSPGCRRSPSSG